MTNNETNRSTVPSFLGGAVVGLIAGLAICFTLTSKGGSQPSLTPQSTISNQEAIRLIQNFQNTNQNDTIHSGHLEWNDFMAYLKYIEEQVSDGGRDISGIEVFFGRYGQVAPHPDHENTQTIVLYPTYEEDGNHIPFDPGSNQNIGTMFNNTVLSTSGSGPNSAYNRSWMSPPRQPTTL